MSEVDTTDAVRRMLGAAGLPASEAELARYAAAYPAQRSGLDALYAVPAARYAEPALRFRAESTVEDWAS
ncbi:hypothetical protein [Amycolatopsis sp. NPDC051903]|uniref:hypothetical protein n=1 Tax=Amycolatopsis sp. NPDC051903 TaxID=3363936 RepID=UPI0037BB7AF9